MENKITESLLLREGLENKALLTDMAKDCIQELKDYLNYTDAEEIPESMTSIVKELVLIKYNRDGAEGITTEKIEGVSQSYLDDLPKSLCRRIRSKRKLPRANYVAE